MTPFPSPSPPPEERYNRSHMRTRVVVEQCFGILKSRYRCLHKSGGNLQYTPTKCAKITMSCLLLHNYCIKRRIPEPEEMVQDDIIDNIAVRVQEGVHANGRGVREEIVNVCFS